MADRFSVIGTAGELGNFDQTLVSAEVELVAQQMFPIEQVINVTSKARKTGRTSQLSQIGAQTMADLSESTTLGMTEASAAFVSTSRTLTQTTKGRDLFITLLAEETGTAPSEAEIVDTLTKAYVKRRMTDLAALYTEAGSGSNLIGAAGSGFSYASHFLQGLTRLAVGQVGGRKNLILAAPAIAEAGAESQFSEWQKLGSAWLDQDISVETGFLGLSPFGVDAWFTNDYSTSGGANVSLMLYQRAIRMEIVMGAKVSRNDTEYGVGSSSLKYGIRTIYAMNGSRDTSTTNSGVVAFLTSAA